VHGPSGLVLAPLPAARFCSAAPVERALYPLREDAAPPVHLSAPLAPPRGSGLGPLLRTPERRLSSLEACHRHSGSPQAAPKTRRFRLSAGRQRPPRVDAAGCAAAPVRLGARLGGQAGRSRVTAMPRAIRERCGRRPAAEHGPVALLPPPLPQVHATFTEFGDAGKRWRFLEAGLWGALPPSYFSEGRYLAFAPPRPPRDPAPCRPGEGEYVAGGAPARPCGGEDPRHGLTAG
jgi:hypothetical protein